MRSRRLGVAVALVLGSLTAAGFAHAQGNGRQAVNAVGARVGLQARECRGQASST